MTDSVKAKHVGAGIHLLDIAEPGAFQFQNFDGSGVDDPAAIPADDLIWFAYCCPRTGKPCSSILIGLDKPTDRPSWQWDGNVYAPTLTPSINCVGGCKWHGFLTKGEFKACG